MTDDVFRIVVTAAVALAALAFVVQAGIMFALYRVTRKAQENAERFTAKAEPVIADARPHIAQISHEAMEITRLAREQVERCGDLLHDAGDKARARLEQIDHSVETTIEQVEQVSGAMKRAVMKPVREVNGLAAGISAAVGTLVRGHRRSSVDSATQDEELLI